MPTLKVGTILFMVEIMLMALGLYLKFLKQVIAGDGGLYEGCTKPMVDLGTYYYKLLNITDKITP